MGSFAFIALFGALLLAGLWVWIRQREEAEADPEAARWLRQANQPADATGESSAVLVSTEHGQLVHLNGLARRWLNLNGGMPTLQDIEQQVQPADNFLSLLTGESESSFQLGSRWVQASSYTVPAVNGQRVVMVMRELEGQQTSTQTESGATINISRTMRIINDIGETVEASMGVELALQVLLEILNRALPSDAGEICLWEDRKNFLEQRGWIGDTRYLLTVAASGGGYQPGDGIAGWMAQHDKPVLIGGQDAVNSGRMMKDNPYTSAIGVPLTLNEAFIGTLTLFSEEQTHYTSQDVTLLQAVSKAVAMAIRNVELYATQEERIKDIASLQQIAEQPEGDRNATPIYEMLNERIARLMQADMCGIFLYGRDREMLQPQMPFYGLPEHVADKIAFPLPPGSPQRDIWQDQPYWVSNDLEEEPLVESLGLRGIVDVAGIDNTALFPMQIAGERIGVIAVSNRQSEGGFTPNDLQNLRVLSSQAAIVVENVRLYQREKRIDTELIGLQEMTHAIGALSHEGEFYAEISERIARLMDSTMCGVLLYDEKQQALISQLPFYGIENELVDDYVIDLPDGTVMQQLWEEDDYWYSNRVQNDTLVFEAGLDSLAERAGIQQTLISVMSAGGRRIGVVQVSNKEGETGYNDRDARLLRIFSAQAAAIVENARLYREVQVRANQAERLRRVAELSSTVMTTQETFKPVLKEVAELTGSELVSINVIDENNNTLVTYPRWTYGADLDEPMINDMNAPGYQHIPARSGNVFISDDALNDKRVLPGYARIAEAWGIRSSLIVPLQVGDRIIGELSISHRESGKFSREDVSTLTTVAAQIASAVERLMLYEATGENLRRRVEELDAIARVSNELTLTVELDKVLEIIRNEARKATGAADATIVILKPQDEWRWPEQPEMDRRVGGHETLTDLTDIEHDAIMRGADPLVVHDYNEHEHTAMPDMAQSASAAAILYLDQIVGVIHVYDDDPNTFDERAAGFLMTLSTKASLAYQNALLYEQQKERGERLRQRVDQLNRIFELGQMVQAAEANPVIVLEAIAFSVQQSVGFDTVLMLLHDEDDHELRRVAQAGMPLEAFERTRDRHLAVDQMDTILKDEYRTSESYFFPIEEVEDWYEPGLNALSTAYEDNRTMEARSKEAWHDGDVFAVKITGQGGNLLGLMSLDRPHNNRRPDRSTIEVLEIFAHQASTMLENSRLFMESQRSAEQEAQLNEMLERIAGTLELDEMTRELAEGVHRLVSFRRMTLVLTNEQDEAYDYLRATYDDNQTLHIEQTQRNMLGRTVINEAFKSHDAQFYSADSEAARHYDDLQSWMEQGDAVAAVLPLNAGGETLGVLHIGSDDPQHLIDEDTQRLLTRIAQLVATTVQNARLFNQAVNLQVLNRSVVESIQQGIVVLDNSGRIISINEFMRHTYGWDDSARNQDLFEYQPGLSNYLKDDIRAVLEEGEPRELVGQTSPDDTGERVVRNFYIYPLRSREQVRGAVLLVEDVTERARLEEAIETRANQLAALTEVSTRITASLEREEVIELAMEEMGWIIPFTTMSMWRRNGSYMVLEGISGVADIDTEDDDYRIRLTEDSTITELVDSQRVVNRTGDDVEMPGLGLPHDEPVLSWMGVPLVNQGHVVGMFILTKNEPDTYNTRQEHHVAFAFASQVAIALANADLFEQTFERTNELGTLLEAAQQTSMTRDVEEVFRTVAELMFSSLEMEDCVILIWDEFDNALEVQFSGNRMGDASHLIDVGTRYSIADYPARERALKKREVVVIIDTDNEERRPPYPFELDEMSEHGAGARMMVPLVVRDEAIGLIQLEHSSSDEESITQQKVRLARALGSQVAIAIENARLTNQTNKRFEELLMINQLSQSISSTLRLEDMIPVLRDQVPEITSAEELYLALYHPEDERITFPLAVREGGEEFVIPPRDLGSDEVSYIIKRKHSLNLGADYFSIDELRRSMGLSNGEGDIENYMGVPLKTGSEVLGVLAIRNVTRKHSFNINDDRILTTVGSQLGAAIQNARLYERVTESAEKMERLVDIRTEELEEERDRLDTLYQITSELARTLDMEQLLERSLGMISKAVGASDGVILTTDPATDALFCRAWLNPNHLLTDPDEDEIQEHPAQGLANWLLRLDESNDNVAVIDDLNDEDYWTEEGRETGLRSAMAVVLENNEDPLGVMVLLAHEVGTFTESHLKLLVPAATQMAASMNSADLYQLIRDQAERMGKLLRAEQEEAQKNQAILESIADGVLLADSNGEIVLFNSAAERILELPREQALGQPVNKLAGMYGQSAARWTQMMNEWADEADRPELADESVSDRIELEDKIISIQLSPVFSGDWFLGTVSVFRDITKDVEADRAKSQFIANVSHEFRTPLTSIKGYTDLLLMSAAGEMPASQLTFINTIKENAERLTSLVEDVLNISKLDSGEESMNMQTIDMDEIMSYVFNQVASRNEDHEIETSVMVADDVPPIRGDHEKLIQVFRNLIDNAFKYTLPGGSINVSVTRDSDNEQVLITIADSGVGIPEEFREAAWRRFERHDQTAVELDIAGTGLGLSLAREFVRLHHGDIWFDSEEGVGTTFYIKLPIEQPSYRTAAMEIPKIDSETIAGD